MSKPNILLADDDRVIRVTFANSLRARDFDVIEAGDGKTAIELGCDCHPDLAIMDFRLPDISGAEAARELQEKANVPSIFLSAYAEQEFFVRTPPVHYQEMENVLPTHWPLIICLQQ